MAAEYSVDICRRLEGDFRAAQVYRPMRVARYDAGTELAYDVTAVAGGNKGRVSLVVEKFVGGGFAGQVYKVRVLGIEGGPIEGLEAGGVFAMKVLVPPSTFSRVFRNILYWVGFQGRFALQVNPAAVRAGALWQKFIRRGAKIKFGDEHAVVDIHATFVDDKLGSCGELREWVDGRTWQLEVDEHLDLLDRWRRGEEVEQDKIGSPEYRAKRRFMADFVKLLNEMGAHEFARQYEWWTCKSQPNCLKRMDTEGDAAKGLVAVDFRAGLTLLPFLPMSPGDFKLIAKGLMRGSIVQFDRGSISKLESFIQSHGNEFADMHEMLQELKADEQIYRDSLIDITHNHIRLLYSRELWSTILDSAATGWKVRNLIDEEHKRKLRTNRLLTLLYFMIAAIPFLGTLLLRVCGRTDWRRHYAAMLTSWDYLRRSIKARTAEIVTVWHRAGRLDGERAPKVAASLVRFLCHLPLSILPACLHRFLTDSKFAREKLVYIFARPFKLYFSRRLREQWMRDMVSGGQKKHILTDEDAETVLSQVNEPFIQKYLKSLAVHVCTLPVTQIVSVLVAWIYARTHPELSRADTAVAVAAILVLFQITPISPGSLVRGFYVLYLVIRERNFKDYNIAVFLGFFKYIGYLAFPIQMSYHYPALARFMAAHWATEAVHIFPVFGERGALLEHWVFRLFYNWPLTIRRRMRKLAEIRASMKPRYWHVGLCAAAAGIIFTLVDFAHVRSTGEPAVLRDIWWLVIILVPVVCGAGVTLFCRGARLWRRIVSAAVCGCLAGLLNMVVLALRRSADGVFAGDIPADCIWRVFTFAVLATIGAIITELKLPDPELR